MSFTLREFSQKDPLDLWLVFPLHEVDHTDLLADCKPNYGGVSEARKLRTEAENLGKVASLEGVCDRLIGSGESCERDVGPQYLPAYSWRAFAVTSLMNSVFASV
ncbi:MAG: hypothetical protein E7001_01735 [Coriobacteriaceae bacterium]|nr:hypothetical protein [Coriobacteriaceae bacterium]